MASFDVDEDAPFYFESLIRFSCEDPFDEEFQQKVRNLHEKRPTCKGECKCVQEVRQNRLLAKIDQWICSTEPLANLIVSASGKCEYCEVDSSVAVLPQDRISQSWNLAKHLLKNVDEQNEYDCSISVHSKLITDCKSENFGKSVLHVAVECGFAPAVKYLVDNYPELIHVASAGEGSLTPFDLAIELNNDEIVNIMNKSTNVKTAVPHKEGNGLLMVYADSSSLLQKDNSKKVISLIVGSESQVEFASHLISNLQAVRPRKVVVRCNYFEHRNGRDKWHDFLRNSDAVIFLMSDELRESINNQQYQLLQLQRYGIEMPVYGKLIHQVIERCVKKCFFYYSNKDHLPTLATHTCGKEFIHSGLMSIDNYNISLKKIREKAKLTMHYVEEI